MGKGSFDHWHSKYFHCQSTEISHAPRQPNCVPSRLSVKTHQFHFTALIQICLKRLKFCNDRLFVLSLPICYVLQSVTKTKSLEQLDTWATFKRLSSTSESRISMMLLLHKLCVRSHARNARNAFNALLKVSWTCVRSPTPTVSSTGGSAASGLSLSASSIVPEAPHPPLFQRPQCWYRRRFRISDFVEELSL